MKKTECDSCNEEIAQEDAFEHERKTYCPECVVEHLKGKHSLDNLVKKKAAAADAEVDLDMMKHSPEAKQTHTYKHY